MKIVQNWTYRNIIWTKYKQVREPYSFYVVINWKSYTIIVPEWFITDLWSIPPIFFIYDRSKYISYILHDYLYSLIWKIGDLEYTQEIADILLDEWLELEWMSRTWITGINIWLSIWGKYKYKKRNQEISDLKLALIK